MVAPRFTASTDIKPMLALITTQSHGSKLLLVGLSGRCRDTARKKIKKAASSRTAEAGSSHRHSHPYTFANQRAATPVVHINQHAQAAPKGGWATLRNFGTE